MFSAAFSYGQASSALGAPARTGVLVVRSAAKGTWVVTKATGKYVLLPVAKSMFVKAAPAAGKFILRRSAKYLIPTALKLAML